MSLLIMSVGILSVMSLFPISLLRTIGAAQRTNATLLNANAIEEIGARAEMLNGAPPWQPNTSYSTGDIVTAVPQPGNMLTSAPRFFVALNGTATSGPVEPNWSLFQAADGAFIPGTAAESDADLRSFDAVQQVASLPINRYSGGVAYGASAAVWDELFLDNIADPLIGPSNSGSADVLAANAYAGRTLVYVVDPLGWAARSFANFPTAAVDITASPNFAGLGPTWNFGVSNYRTSGAANDFPGLARLDAGLRNNDVVMNVSTSQTRSARLAEANELIGLPDTYDEIVRVAPEFAAGTVSTITPTAPDTPYSEIDLPRTVSRDALDDFTGRPARIVVTNATGTASEARTVLVGAGAAPTPRIDLTVTPPRVLDVRPPFQITGADVGRVSIENYLPQFTFLVTIRKTADGPARRSIVVFFNRQLAQQEERPIRASFGLGQDSNGDGDIDDAGDIVLDRQSILIRWNRFDKDGLREERPPVKAGGFVFDPINGSWYEVASITEPAVTVGGTTVPQSAILKIQGNLTLQHGSIGADPSPITDDPAGGSPAPAIILPGVVRVFEQGLGQ